MDPLDELDPRRFDADAIAHRLNAFYELSDAQQEATLNEWECSGMAEAEHALSGLLPETHNATAVVRDLTGELMLLWTEGVDDVWEVGLLRADNLTGGESLEDQLEYAQGGFAHMDLSLIRRVLDRLPSAPGPIITY